MLYQLNAPCAVVGEASRFVGEAVQAAELQAGVVRARVLDRVLD